MTKKQQNNHLGTEYRTEIRTMISGLRVISGSYCGLLLKNYLCHGASGIARRKKRSSSVEDALLPIMKECNIRVGEYPEPVTFPPSFVSVNERSFLQRLLQIIIHRGGFFCKFVIKTNNRTGYNNQFAQMMFEKVSVLRKHFRTAPNYASALKFL